MKTKLNICYKYVGDLFPAPTWSSLWTRLFKPLLSLVVCFYGSSCCVLDPSMSFMSISFKSQFCTGVALECVDTAQAD